ncbi:GroES-like protein [Rickenella mellea]|uniref:GroES-like protein n=1 Tax=Rickenella mellea TaxID=50990 RepID=A0A4Y7PZI3_9AGAM|nr:GroES-like protein [Rickenella mellea]
MPVFKALTITERKQKTPLTLFDFEEPQLGEGEFLVENVAVAQNPVDIKQLDHDVRIPSIPWTNGGDIAGKVYKVGPGVAEEDIKVGDRVISFVSQKTARHGGYQTHSITDITRTVKLPDSYTFEEGSTIPLTFTTAGAGVMHGLKITLPSPGDVLPLKPRGEPLLVWGGSSSVGSYAIQLASLAGFEVIATASKAHHDYVKSLGAQHVFDYHDPNVIEQIRQVSGDKLSLVYDTISVNETAKQCIASITSPTGGLIAIIRPVVDPALSTPTIKIIPTGGLKAFEFPEIGAALFGLLQTLLNRKLLKPNPVKVVDGGLNGVNDGFDLGRKGKISGEKLVYRIADTKF